MVNKVNGASFGEILSASRLQKSDLQRTWQLHSQVPWCGSFLKYEDTNPWPTLFLASKKDRQIPWSYVDSVMKEQERRGRKTKLFLFPSSGQPSTVSRQFLAHNTIVSCSPATSTPPVEETF